MIGWCIIMTKYDIETIEKEIIERLDQGEQVYLESGCLNDCITAYSVKKFKKYSWQEYEDKEITFTTTACVFPEHIRLSDWDNVDTEEFKDKLFVHVW